MNGFETLNGPKSTVAMIKLIKNGKFAKFNESNTKSLSIQFEDTAYSPQLTECIELKWLYEFNFYKWKKSNCEFKFTQCECSGSRFGIHSIKKYSNRTQLLAKEESLENYKTFFITYCVTLYGFLCLFFICLSIIYIK